MAPKTNPHNVQTDKASWTRPQLRRLGTIADVAMAKVTGIFDGPHS